jgi:dTDP-4-dehydrorhamnose 3,5-epimerase
MKIIPTKIKDVLIIEPEVFVDDRGWFVESYNRKKLGDFEIDIDFVQDNHSFSAKKGLLRGLHLQNHPFAQAKLVRCTKGAVLDVAVDLRKNSPTYKQWVATKLTEDNKRQVFIPQGFAHGFLLLEDNSEFHYKVDNHYSKEHDRSIRFDDPEIGIDWGNDNPILSDKDKNAPFLKDCDVNFE